MKRTMQTLLFIFLLGLPLSSSAAVAYFTMVIDSSVQAGDDLTVVVTAKNANGTVDTSYYGTVTFTVSPYPGTVSPTVSGNFASGTGSWETSTMNFIAADNEVVLTCTGEGGATGNIITTVYAGPGAGLLILLPGQTHTPGFYPGVSPYGEIDLLEGISHRVTVYVVDALWNCDSNYSPTTITVEDSYVDPDPKDYYTENGKAYYSFRFTTKDHVTIGFNSSFFPDSFSNAVMVNVLPADIGYLHIKVPSQITAGAPFSLTATVSSQEGDPDQVLTSNNDGFKINRYIAGTSDPALGNWGGPSENLSMSNGVVSRDDFTYDRAESIYLCGEKTSGDVPPYVTGVPSSVIEVLPNVPATIQVTLDPAQVQAKHTTHITARMLDQYGNPTQSALHSFIVKFDQVSGSGFLSVSQTATDLNGNAYCDFTGGVVNEEALIRVRAEHTATQHIYAETVMTVKVSVAAASPGAILNYPNPFNPAQDQKTSINYYLDSRSNVEIRIYDAFGRLVLSRDLSETAADSVSQNATASGGAYWEWDGRNGESRIVANGIYLVKVTARGSTGVQEFKRRVGVLK